MLNVGRPVSASLLILLGSLLAAPGGDWQTHGLAAELRGSAAGEGSPGSGGLIYKPRKESSPRGRIGGGLRAGGPDAPTLYPLAPDHVGFTHAKDPCFFWYISKATTSPIRFTLVDSRKVKPVLDAPLAESAEPGIQMTCLKPYGVALEPEVQYRWYITVVLDPESESRNLVIGGTVERTNPVEDLMIRESCRREEVRCFAVNGLWYDAIAAISDLIAAAPHDKQLRLQRASLLEQVGLSEVAQYDRNFQAQS